MSFIAADVQVKNSTVYLKIKNQAGFLPKEGWAIGSFVFKSASYPQLETWRVYLKGASEDRTIAYQIFDNRESAKYYGHELAEALKTLNRQCELGVFKPTKAVG